MALRAIDPTKPILGYNLKHRIGAGGYGEVWAAEAPGGLPKAVKFIFGYHDEKRAQTELKSLNRIRSVRHPFLLSLERIDVVDGQMVVISELADMCLKTRFEQCVESGLKGIPRSELIGYVREAADALDFLSDEFRLQHLDVKPENLLLVSGHIKVADFGLVKDIHDGTQSMMSGLTPAYAPPELFDGRPSKASDQYSLAIVFQEMLSGIRPFDGSTAVQLAGQHMKERPNLKPLPREDQSAVARALSKDPELRYPNCSALIDALSAEKTQQAAPKPRTRTKLREGRRRRKRHSESTLTLTAGTRAFDISETEITPLPKLDYDPKEARFRPTLFLGVGNTGTQIVRQIRRRLNERDGAAEKLPAIKLLCIDSDASGLAAACDRRATDGLGSEEIFQMPLRKPEEYRNDARMHLSWLSRRWIYNVPKSLQTEGIRPLGRLAMATHIDDLAVRLRQVLSDLVLPEHLATTADSLELEPLKQPRVVIVGSISGGTCSGMGIDLAYIVRTILRQLSVADEDVLGIFTHASTAREQRRELAIANSLAFLNELYHFSCVEEYPGDDSCGIPPSTDGTTTFASTYFLHFGNDLEEEEYQQRVDSVAEYLYLGAATSCGTFFDNCRRAEQETTGLPLRTMGLSSGVGGADLIANSSKLLSQLVIREWTTEAPRKGFDALEVATNLLRANNLTAEAIVHVVHETIEQVLKDPVSTVREKMMEQVDFSDRHKFAVGVSDVVANVFGFDLPEGSPTTPVFKTIEALTEHFSRDRVPKLVEAAMELVDAPGPRLSAALQVAREMQQQLTDQCKQIDSFLEVTREQIETDFSEFVNHEGPQIELPELATKLAESLLKRFSMEAVRKLCMSVVPASRKINTQVNDLKVEFSYVTGDIDDEGFSGDVEITNGSPPEAFHSRTLKRIVDRAQKLGDRVDQQLQHNMLDQSGGFRAVIGDVELRERFRREFDEAVRASIVEQLREISLADSFDRQLTAVDFAQWIGEAARPRSLQCGGATRWVQLYPTREKPSEKFVAELEKAVEQEATLIPATAGEIVVCVEGERVPLDNVAMHLLQDRPDSIEYASRLHTRTDIAWTHISSMR